MLYEWSNANVSTFVGFGRVSRSITLESEFFLVVREAERGRDGSSKTTVNFTSSQKQIVYYPTSSKTCRLTRNHKIIFKTLTNPLQALYLSRIVNDNRYFRLIYTFLLEHDKSSFVSR